MDILYLLDQLEEVLTSGSKVPLTNRVMVDEHEVLEILDQIRVAIPEELKAARRMTQERDTLLEEARAEAERIRRQADQQMDSMVSNHALVRAAEERAADVEDQASREAEDMRRQADAYAAHVLERLRGQLDQLSQAVDRGLRQLEAGEPDEDDRRRGR